MANVLGDEASLRNHEGEPVVLEDFSEKSLERLTKSRSFDLGEKLAIAIAATEALGALHARNIVHGDVSLSSFRYDPATGVLEITNHGAATAAGCTCSPLDDSADLRALGAALHELFTGEPPHSSDDPKKNPAIPKPLSDMLMRLLSKRPESTHGVKADLERCRRELVDNGTIAPFPIDAPIHREMKQRIAELAEELRKKNLELQEAHDMLRRTQAQLVQSEKMASLGRLTVGIAHEIKNPLNFVNNFAQINIDLVAELEETLASTPTTPLSEVADVLADIRTGSDKIVEHGKRADGIVRSMMQQASGASGTPHEVDLNALVEDYVKLSYHGSRADAQPFELRIERDYDDAVGTVSVISQDLGRVLVNLFSNALYSVGEKKRSSAPGYMPTLHVSTRREGKSVKIEIRDNGMGIATDVQSRIFEPFFTTKPGNAGTGLGLSMSQEIVVKGHGGDLAFESVEGDHATFVLTLPG